MEVNLSTWPRDDGGRRRAGIVGVQLNYAAVLLHPSWVVPSTHTYTSLSRRQFSLRSLRSSCCFFVNVHLEPRVADAVPADTQFTVNMTMLVAVFPFPSVTAQSDRVGHPVRRRRAPTMRRGAAASAGQPRRRGNVQVPAWLLLPLRSSLLVHVHRVDRRRDRPCRQCRGPLSPWRPAAELAEPPASPAPPSVTT